MAFMAVAKYFPIFFCSVRLKLLPAKDVLPFAATWSNLSVTGCESVIKSRWKNTGSNKPNMWPTKIIPMPSNLRSPFCARFSFRPTAVQRSIIKCWTITKAWVWCSKPKAIHLPTHSNPTMAIFPAASAKHTTTKPFHTTDAKTANLSSFSRPDFRPSFPVRRDKSSRSFPTPKTAFLVVSFSISWTSGWLGTTFLPMTGPIRSTPLFAELATSSTTFTKSSKLRPHSFLFLQAPAGRIQRLFRWHTEAICRPFWTRYRRFGSTLGINNLSHSHDFNYLANLWWRQYFNHNGL